MGRKSGSIALQAGLACGAESIIVPEIEVDLDEVSAKLLRGHQRGKNHSIILVAEGAGSAYKIGEELKLRTGFDTRVTILGHIQRGGNPTALDVVTASEMGAEAVNLLRAGRSDQMTARVQQQVIGLPLEVAYGLQKPFNKALYDLANQLAI
jgi:6-phosphofructokinase 1